MNKHYLRWLRAVLSDPTYYHFNTKDAMLDQIRNGYLRREFLNDETPDMVVFKTIPW